MKITERAGWIVASLAFGPLGCEAPPEPAGRPAHAEGPAAPSSVSTPEPPIEPSPVPSLPDTPHGDAAPKGEARTEAPK